MNKNDLLFFDLLQIGLGNSSKLTHIPTSEEWEELYKESEKQTVVGVALKGIEVLPASSRPLTDLILQWIGVCEITRKQNDLLDNAVVSDSSCLFTNMSIFEHVRFAQ